MDAQALFLQEAPPRKRLRTSHAVGDPSKTARATLAIRPFMAVVERTRLIRLPAAVAASSATSAAVAKLEQECTYGSEANSRGKTDLVLDGVLRIERFLHELGSSIQTTAAGQTTTTPNTILQQSPGSGSVVSPAIAPSVNSNSESPLAESARKTIYQHQATSGSSSQDASGLDNAVLESMHTSTTEAVLQWHHFDVLPTLRTGFESIFHLERSRPPLVVSHVTLFPYLSQDELSEILRSFEDNVNFWYPTASQGQLRMVRSVLGAGAPEKDSLESCLALLVMALGCASQATSNLDAGDGSLLAADAAKKRAARRKMGDVYFGGALKKLHIVHLSLSSTAAQCLFFVALYFAFLCRPLQAWEFIGGAAGKCLTLLGNEAESGDDEDKERTRRIFWACYILER
ncbi:hypothetical protein NLG97_g2068 [Lecanicillium saksenae]|uniref:Uncharacterized protein n=1 Tax=Lecanicillium saksenae TaxID=468837 RepID=A0ACC1R258_9HYPO|nr:hypothetical protein NLG97_g2068 [Lecanicillium saksenae]